MNFYVLTLFPEMIEQGMHTSIIGRAINKGLVSLEAVNIRDFAEPARKGRIDDYPYGGGAGMVMQAQPVFDAWRHVCADVRSRQACAESAGEQTGMAEDAGEQAAVAEDACGSGRAAVRTVYLTPQGETFTQAKARELALEENIIFLCGHYEGIDERVLEEIVTDEISIGDYVLTGGELPAMVLMDSISRMVPGVLTNEQSGLDESFSDGLLEYPQYSRPEVWHDRTVPPILLSGHHAKVDEWRRQQSLERTYRRRPDLLETAALTKEDRRYLQQLLALDQET